MPEPPLAWVLRLELVLALVLELVLRLVLVLRLKLVSVGRTEAAEGARATRDERGVAAIVRRRLDCEGTVPRCG
jgi:hypothetical protein